MSSYRIYENQYKCAIRENEFNYTQNPSARSGSGEFYYSFVTGSYFSPYVTTIGLYNDNKEIVSLNFINDNLKSVQSTPKAAIKDAKALIEAAEKLVNG
jgi:hypothetical protein